MSLNTHRPPTTKEPTMNATTRTRAAIIAAALAVSATLGATAGLAAGTTINLNVRTISPAPTAVACDAAVDDYPELVEHGTTAQLDSVIATCDHRRRPATYCPEDAWCAVAEANEGNFVQTGTLPTDDYTPGTR
jgi:hypothetical protein